jgi:adhesin transport system membrane fusion protein
MANRDIDTEYMRDLRAAVMRRPRFSANLLLFSVVAFIAWAIYWADGAILEEVTSGQGQVIPSSRIQVIQNLEGGIVSKIHIGEGDIVRTGQLLLEIDTTQFASQYGEDRVKFFGYIATVSRLEAEVQGKQPKFPDEIVKERPNFVASEMDLYRARQSELNAAISVLSRQMDQKRQEIVELRSRVQQLQQSLDLANEELAIIEPMVERGVTSRVELIRLKRSTNDLTTDLVGAQQAIPRALSALSEAERRIDERRALFLTEARTQLAQVKVEMASLSETLTSSQDRLRRTDVRSPVDGAVKKLNVNTPGGVIRPGMDLMEIVPLQDSLQVEAKVRPADIAFLRPGQDAKVKITAYDYAIYGTLPAKLENISADTIVDEEGNSFYQIRVRTDQNYLQKDGERLPIISGMVAEVDVLTGEKSVLDYLMKPLIRGQQKALRER